jgi:hypothetical protein
MRYPPIMRYPDGGELTAEDDQPGAGAASRAELIEARTSDWRRPDSSGTADVANRWRRERAAEGRSALATREAGGARYTSRSGYGLVTETRSDVSIAFSPSSMFSSRPAGAGRRRRLPPRCLTAAGQRGRVPPGRKADQPLHRSPDLVVECARSCGQGHEDQLAQQVGLCEVDPGFVQRLEDAVRAVSSAPEELLASVLGEMRCLYPSTSPRACCGRPVSRLRARP